MSAAEPYSLPKVWRYEKENGGQFANINRPTAGARFDRELPVGRHPLQLYSLATPNGQKVTILLEELLEAGYDAEYDAWLVHIGNGDQFSSGFTCINPNGKIPALVDRGVSTPRRVFESGAILLYLAEKFDAFLPRDPTERTETLNWLFWQMGAAPYIGGGFGHFYSYAPERWEYPIDRFTMEVKRQLDLLDRQFQKRSYVAGETYTIADMALWPWFSLIRSGELYDAATFLDVENYCALVGWIDRVGARPGVRRGQIVNRINEGPLGQLPERHDASDFDASPVAAKQL